MGREVRRVPKDWKHPREEDQFVPLFEGGYSDAVKEWTESLKKVGLQATLEDLGNPPRRDEYMPEWSSEEADHIMMYEDTTEGTPISPAFKTPEELARWLADTGASAFGDSTASYEDWLHTIKRGFAIATLEIIRGL